MGLLQKARATAPQPASDSASQGNDSSEVTWGGGGRLHCSIRSHWTQWLTGLWGVVVNPLRRNPRGMKSWGTNET